MAHLTPETRRYIRGYEPVFRSMLTNWLKAHLDATGKATPTLEDVNAGVAHVFDAMNHGIEVKGGDEKKSLEEYHAGEAQSWKEALHGLREVAA